MRIGAYFFSDLWCPDERSASDLSLLPFQNSAMIVAHRLAAKTVDRATNVIQIQ
jgi:hypothetical protein